MRFQIAPKIVGDLIDNEDVEQAQLLAMNENREIYTWKTEGLFNWLERGVHNVDKLALLVLPKGLPEIIDLPDDDPDDAL